MATIHRHRPAERVPIDAHGTPDHVFTRDLFGPAIEHCSFCGQTASGYWSGTEMISVCAVCAIDTLPKLAADAILGEFADSPRAAERLRHALERMTTRFWQAGAVAMSRAAGLRESA